jgi:methylglutaconyl-CoA hydratase
MSDERAPVTLSLEAGVAHVRLSRPEKRNAFDDRTAAALLEAFAALERRDDVRAVLLVGEGPTFCAGGDLAWMARAAGWTREENLADAGAFQASFERIDRCPFPVVVRVQGAALGGGAGLVAVADVAVVAEDARIGFPEVRLGLVPGVIAPYVVRRIGEGHARHLFLTGAVFDGREARRLGLAHVVAPPEALDDAVARVLSDLRAGGPGALRRAKALVHAVVRAPDAEAAARVARTAIADARASVDGREGTRAFLEKRPPGWRA